MKTKIFILSFILACFLWIPYIFPYFSNVDEPGYFASAIEISKGKFLYKDVFEAKGPGIMLIFAFFVKFFPQNFTFFLHLFMFLLLFLDSFLIYKILSKKMEKIFIEEIKNKEVKFFIDATSNSLIGIPYYTLDKYPEIKKFIDENYVKLPFSYSNCEIYKHSIRN